MSNHVENNELVNRYLVEFMRFLQPGAGLDATCSVCYYYSMVAVLSARIKPDDMDSEMGAFEPIRQQ